MNSIAEEFLEVLKDLDETSMKLPCDAEGIPIHIGDRLKYVCEFDGGCIEFHVLAVANEPEALNQHGKVWVFADIGEGLSRYEASKCYHIVPNTVEDELFTLLKVFTGRDFEYMGELESYTFKQCASKLQLKENS